MSLSKPYSRNIESLLHVGEISIPEHTSPSFAFLKSLGKIMISGGNTRSTPLLTDSTSEWKLINLRTDIGGCNTPCFKITGGVISSDIRDTVGVIKREGETPFTTLADIFHVCTGNSHLKIMGEKEHIPLNAGDIVVYRTGGTPFHKSLLPGQRAPLQTKAGFELLIFLPMIQNTELFEENVLGNRHVIRELREYIDDRIGCFDAAKDNHHIVQLEWMAERAEALSAKKFDRLANIDSIYAGKETDGQKKRKTAA